jgi:hypothetical protein
LLAIGILFQGCKIYHKYNVSTEQAIDSEKNVKVMMEDGTRYYFDQIKTDGHILYGVNKLHGQFKNTLLDHDQIKYIYLIDPEKSAKRTRILVPVLVSGGIILLIGYGIYKISNTPWLSWD